MLTLYPHQDTAVGELRAALRQYRSVLLYAPCGFGKTVVFAYVVWLAAKKGKRIIFAVHRKELIQQTANTFDKFGLEYSYIAAGRPCDKSKSIFIASIPTLRNRVESFDCDFLIVDEAHLSMAATWQAVIKYYQMRGAYVLGCSASPRRLDGKGLGHNFQFMVKGPTPAWLIDNGFLSRYRMFAPSQPDLSGLHRVGGDYRKDEAAELMNKPTITGDAISHWLQHAAGKRTVVYAVSIEHSKAVAAAFRAAGVPAVHVDGETDEEIRIGCMRDLADGRILIICNCQLLTEGVDIAALAGKDVTIECIVNLRPTQSLALWTQIVGRGLRRKAEPAIILDHAGASSTLGLPDDDIEWSLEYTMPKKSQNKEGSPRVCPKCFGCSRTGSRVCQICGSPFPVEAREVEHVDGELAEVTVSKARKTPEQRREHWEKVKDQVRSDSLEALIALGIKKYGEGKGERWANYVYQGRLKKRGITNESRQTA